MKLKTDITYTKRLRKKEEDKDILKYKKQRGSTCIFLGGEKK
jgi:hypothetical protein